MKTNNGWVLSMPGGMMKFYHEPKDRCPNWLQRKALKIVFGIEVQIL